ncbi:fibropellin-1-like [Mya arenaria]|uniref:fibropellin-1-like n=1 Tax=Mya arenaria TaxID=6604 RepID=UPI0022E158CA|nr:fibropellin-1-like [Mya arenaria]
MSDHRIYKCICFIMFMYTLIHKGSGKVKVAISIKSYENVNGTAYGPKGDDRKCCDGPNRANCTLGDTCDTYFNICVGRIHTGWDCQGASFTTKPANDTNSIMNVPIMEGIADSWSRGMLLVVSINDDDDIGLIQTHDQIDRLIDEIEFSPSPDPESSQWHSFTWGGASDKTQMTVLLSLWCDDDYYGPNCQTYCKGIKPMALCDTSGNHLCQPSDAVVLDFYHHVNQSSLPDITFNIHKFVQDQVCHSNMSSLDYLEFDIDSNSMSFTLACDDHDVLPVEFESLLQTVQPVTLTNYFPAGIVRGPFVTPTGHEEHIKPNVYVGVQILKIYNPHGTSFEGSNVNSARRCCDVKRFNNCPATGDVCDTSLSICIGEIINNVCIGSVTLFPTLPNSNSISACGSAYIDDTNNVAHVAHTTVGGMRLIKNTTSIQVILKDNDGNSSDIIDILKGNVTIKPGPNVTYALNTKVVLTKWASVSLNLIFWCAEGHSGPLCHADNGTDRCQDGWYGDECEKQLNACHPNPCKNQGTCSQNATSEYTCLCPFGFTGGNCESDLDECQMNVCQHNATCTNFYGSFQCTCPALYEGIICQDSKLPGCDPNPCSNGKCVMDFNDPDEYRCICPSGFEGKNCNERMACSGCTHGKCVVSEGQSHCQCQFGFGGPQCTEDENECEAHICENNSTCHNTFGNFSCECKDGYTGKVCSEASGPCSKVTCLNHGTCIQVTGSTYMCMCTAGFAGDMCENRVDLCARIICSNGGVCENVFEDFLCNCSSHWSGKLCDVDVNECSQSLCVHSRSCTNTAGSYACDCQDGWTGFNCESDIDECNTGATQSLCNHGQCVNTQGSFKCACNTGFTGIHCENILDFCTNETCSGNGNCFEKPTGHCVCKLGYNGDSCENDINECQIGICGGNSVNCTNMPGTYSCTCKKGWTGRNCTDDIDECAATKVIPCNGNGLCHNTKGSYLCTCFPGFSGKDCETFVDTCKDKKCEHNGTCVIRNSETKCVCTPGWTDISCGDDVNECESDAPCNQVGVCVNTDGSYYCDCYGGWTGSACQNDVNECLSNICQHNGVCTNLAGSYNCACQSHWEGMKCEVPMTSEQRGDQLQFTFSKNITSNLFQVVVSFTHRFLVTYICNATDLSFAKETFKDNIFTVFISCPTGPITQTSISKMLSTISNDTLSNAFPLPLQSLLVIPSGPSTQQIPVKSSKWISKYWPVFAGGAALIIVVVAVVGVILRVRKRKDSSVTSYLNPSYSSHDNSELKEYDS